MFKKFGKKDFVYLRDNIKNEYSICSSKTIIKIDETSCNRWLFNERKIDSILKPFTRILNDNKIKLKKEREFEEFVATKGQAILKLCADG